MIILLIIILYPMTLLEKNVESVYGGIAPMDTDILCHHLIKYISKEETKKHVLIVKG